MEPQQAHDLTKAAHVSVRLQVAVVLLGLWLAATVSFAAALSAQEGIGFQYALISGAANVSLLSLLLCVVWACLVRFEDRSFGSKVALHLALAIVVVPLWELSKLYYLKLMVSPEVAEIYVEEAGYWGWLQSFSVYVMAVTALVALLTFRRLRSEERRASRLQISMREAELRALRAQLRPHFLFNTLNSIYSLIPSSPERAGEMVVQLSDLLRETLEHSDQETVTLASELQLAERYLQIEATRMGERLETRFDIGTDCQQALVPPFILQPLIENAIHHGAAPSTEAVQVTVRARAEKGRLRLVVEDDGCGLTDDAPTAGGGRGLRITRSRLESLYGSAASFDLRAREPRGCVAQLELPREASETTEPATVATRATGEALP